jgi:3-phosphoshikimate 1-carboxyvinyltransferase
MQKTLFVPAFHAPASGSVDVPGSKSINNRALLLAAMAKGKSRIRGALASDDTMIFADCLARLGINVVFDHADGTFEVESGPREPRLDGKTEIDLWVGNAGTAARFLMPFAACCGRPVRFDGVAAMRRRPMGDLLTALQLQGATIKIEGETGFLPVTIAGLGLRGGEILLHAEKSSQQISALMMAAPLATADTVIRLLGDVVSAPYIDLTARMMSDWGASVECRSSREIHIAAHTPYQPQDYLVEPDASSASYFFAAAAATGGRVAVRNLSKRSLQGDVGFVDVLERMGCSVSEESDALVVEGPGQLRGVTVDMNAISDTAPTLAAIASGASSPVTITGVEHMRWKETDRVEAVVAELRKMGARIEVARDGMTVHPGKLTATTVETYQDHRIAMSMTIAGIANNGVTITDPSCVGKTFSNFFDVIKDLRQQSHD